MSTNAGSINPTLVRIVAVASGILQEGSKTDPKYPNTFSQCKNVTCPHVRRCLPHGKLRIPFQVLVAVLASLFSAGSGTV